MKHRSNHGSQAGATHPHVEKRNTQTLTKSQRNGSITHSSEYLRKMKSLQSESGTRKMTQKMGKEKSSQRKGSRSRNQTNLLIYAQ